MFPKKCLKFTEIIKIINKRTGVKNGRGIRWLSVISQDLPLGNVETSKVTVEVKYSDQTTDNLNFLVPHGKDYILTEEDKAEIAQQAAGLVDTALLSVIGSGVLE